MFSNVNCAHFNAILEGLYLFSINFILFLSNDLSNISSSFLYFGLKDFISFNETSTLILFSFLFFFVFTDVTSTILLVVNSNSDVNDSNIVDSAITSNTALPKSNGVFFNAGTFILQIPFSCKLPLNKYVISSPKLSNNLALDSLIFAPVILTSHSRTSDLSL